MSRLSSAFHKATGGISKLFSAVKPLSKLGTALVGNPLGNLAFTTPTSTIGKASIAAGAGILAGNLLGGGAGQDSIPQENVGFPNGNAGFVYGNSNPYYLPPLDFGNAGYSSNTGGSDSGGSAPSLFGSLSPATLLLAVLGFVLFLLLIVRK